jgi:hypothetical protein
MFGHWRHSMALPLTSAKKYANARVYKLKMAEMKSATNADDYIK